MMNDSVSLIELFFAYQNKYNSVINEKNVLANHLIANGVIVQKQGQWIVLGQRTYGSGRSYTHYCSECGQHGFDDYKRCPNCGAKMRKD